MLKNQVSENNLNRKWVYMFEFIFGKKQKENEIKNYKYVMEIKIGQMIKLNDTSFEYLGNGKFGTNINVFENKKTEK